jgi:hypothetical protein
LWDKRLTLLNGTSIPYRQLKIPCCTVCNNERLAELEGRIERTTAIGYEAVMALPPLDIFRWLAKIYLGIQYKELFLKSDRVDANSEAILNKEFLKQYAILHLWLQLSSCTNQSEFSPGSIWVFRAQVPEDISNQFDLVDDITNGVIAMRLGGFVFIADFLENGAHKGITEDRYSKLEAIPLHPMQFRELAAIMIYEARLLGQESHVSFFQTEQKLAVSIEWRSTIEGDAVMHPWVKADYARILANYMGIPFEEAFFPPDLVVSWLHDPYGNFVYWPLGEPHPFAGQSPETTLNTL